jgi:hypothetical protein
VRIAPARQHFMGPWFVHFMFSGSLQRLVRRHIARVRSFRFLADVYDVLS